MNEGGDLYAYVGQTRGEKLIERLRALGIGECTVRGELPPRRAPWFYDNGAYSDWTAGRAFDGLKFQNDIDRIRRGEIDTPPDFVVAPDQVAGGVRSLEVSLLWIDRLEGLPLYLAVQDGMRPSDVLPVLDVFAGIFVGGTLPWKLATGPQWVDIAHAQGLRCHVGRVGTVPRVDWARTIGADSIDSSLPLWSEGNLQAFVGALKSRQGRLWTEQA
jgi:hypothetical protein